MAIALADDSVIVREGVARVLAAQPDIEVVVSCGDLPSLPETVERERPDVVVTDFRLAFTSGVSANSVCFERELLDHYRFVFEKRG